jgi:predicted DCC family thiol-disulfide oxidoreductase YuxK
MTCQLDPSVHEWTKYEWLILFDGVCNWCNAWVNVTIAHDPDGQFKFWTLQSEPAQRILCDLQLSATDYQTFLLLEGAVSIPSPQRC